MQGYDMYSNSLGLNGQAGRDAALGAFQAGPGYQWNVDQATDQAARAANKLGMTYSGNTIDAQTRLAQNLANQEWGNWQKNLQGFQGAAQNAVAGQTGVMADLANTYEGQAKDLSTINMNQGNKLADLSANAYGQVGENTLNSQRGDGAGGADAGHQPREPQHRLRTVDGESRVGQRAEHARQQQPILGHDHPGGAGRHDGRAAGGRKQDGSDPRRSLQMGMQLLGGGAGGGFNLGSFFGGSEWR